MDASVGYKSLYGAIGREAKTVQTFYRKSSENPFLRFLWPLEPLQKNQRVSADLCFSHVAVLMLVSWLSQISTVKLMEVTGCAALALS